MMWHAACFPSAKLNATPLRWFLIDISQAETDSATALTRWIWIHVLPLPTASGKRLAAWAPLEEAARVM